MRHPLAVVGRIHGMRRGRVPEVRRMSEVECGLACLTMILNYHGCGISLPELRDRSGVGRDGVSALEIVRTARDHGMRVRAVSLQRSDLRFVTLPAIVHWEFDHFLVVERWSPERVDVIDPARGRYRLTVEEFDAGFTGVIILLEPGAAFDRREPAPRGTFRAYVLQYLRQTPGTFLQIIGVSLLLLLLGLALPLLTKVVVDQVLPFRMRSVMPVLAIGILGLFLAQTIATLLREWLLVYLRARVDLSMMLGFVEHLLALPYKFFQERSTGDLLARVNSHATLRELLSNQLLSTVMDSGLVVFYLLVLLWQSPPFGLLTLGVGLLEAMVLLLSYGSVSRLAAQELAAFGKSQEYLGEAVMGIATLKAVGAEERTFDRWSNLFFDHLNISLRYNYVSGTVAEMLTTLPLFGQLALLWVGATQVLRGIDLTARSGERIAIVGVSGSGKSTLGKLLLGLYTVADERA